MEKWIILSLSLFALAHQTKATSRCPVDVMFIIDASESISDSDFKTEKNFVKQAAREMDIATGKSRAAIIMFSTTATVTVTLEQHPTYEEFQRAVDSLNRPADQVGDSTGIDEALNAATNDVFSAARTSVRRIAVVLSDGKQGSQGSTVDGNIKTATENLRKLGVRVLAVATGPAQSQDTRILRMVTERDEDLVQADDFDALLGKLPGILSCGACVCTNGDGYIIIDNYETKKNRERDDIRFEFKSALTGTDAGTGKRIIMHIEGDHLDQLYVGYTMQTALEYKFDLGSGARLIMGGAVDHNIGNKWEKVHMTRVDRNGRIEVTHAGGLQIATTAESPGSNNRLDIPSSQGYFLGSPPEGINGGLTHLPPNFIGCIRYFSVDEYEPIVNAWVDSPDSSIEIQKGSMRPCTASDELYE